MIISLIGVFGELACVAGILLTMIISQFNNKIGFMKDNNCGCGMCRSKKYYPIYWLLPFAGLFVIMCAIGRMFIC